jgi:hypothetical protein
LSSIAASTQNVVMAVGDSVTLSVAGVTVGGTPITTFDSVRYVLNSIVDTLRLRVSPTGVVTALASSGTSPVLLNVFAYKDNLGAGDQVIIQVTPTSFTGATLSIQPSASDSARVALGNGKTITPVIKNQTTGTSVAGPRIRLWTSPEDAKKLGCYRLSFPTVSAKFAITSAQMQLNACATTYGLNQIIGAATGTAWVHANVLVYGVPLRDSVLYTVTYANHIYVGVQNNNLAITCQYCNAFITPGGIITFQNNFRAGLGISVTYTFDNPAAATAATPASVTGGSSGNVTTLSSGQSSDRVFPTPGTYVWTETVSGATPPFTNGTYQGTVVVQ